MSDFPNNIERAHAHAVSLRGELHSLADRLGKGLDVGDIVAKLDELGDAAGNICEALFAELQTTPPPEIIVGPV